VRHVSLQRAYQATAKGRKAMVAAKMKVRELFSELLEDERSGSGSSRRPAAARDLMKSLLIELRANVDEAQQPKAQALLETLAAVTGGLIKTFDDYERSGL
jgi:hypothetical protein